MKATTYRTWTACAVSALTAIAAMRASADQTATANKNEKTCTGTVTSVDRDEHRLKVKGFLLSKEFNLGENCAYAFVDRNASTINSLRPGQKVKVSYENARGVLVADRVEQIPLRYEGMVKAIDAEKRILTVHHRTMNRKFEIAGDCKVVLRDERTGALTDVKPGHWVTVTYESPDKTATAWRIDQTSATFTGDVTAIDLTDRTIKAKHLFGSKNFNLADNCAIVLNGKTDGQMSDLKPGDELVFSYDQVNGVNVVNRIARPDAPLETPTELSVAKP